MPARDNALVCRFRLRITKGDEIAIGPGKIDLLEAIGRHGSLSAAARALGMSYRRAWLLLETMNRCFTAPVVSTAAGGSGGGGSVLTPLGHEIVERYRRIEDEAARATRRDLNGIARHLR